MTLKAKVKRRNVIENISPTQAIPTQKFQINRMKLTPQTIYRIGF